MIFFLVSIFPQCLSLIIIIPFSGKSFLANQLAKQDGLFKISNSADPCTTGIDICQRVLPATVFGSNSSSCVALLDVEGQGDRSMEYDSRLATVVLSLSKVVLFNWRDGLQVDRFEVITSTLLLNALPSIRTIYAFRFKHTNLLHELVSPFSFHHTTTVCLYINI